MLVPERIVHSRTHPTVEKPESSASPLPRSSLLSMGVVPNTRVKSKTDYIKEFLAFSSLNNFHVLSNTDNAPLKTKFTNLERILSDESDLRKWTRFIVENDRDDDFVPPAEPSSAESIDLKIDDFIDYLVEHRGFSEEDLQFLHDTNYNSDYDTIDEELTEIKATYAAAGMTDIFFRSGAVTVTATAIPTLVCVLALLVPFL
ncbi:hypothetical protein JCM33374_g2408 [Metschnikowia sp. JCM 33374]|nr:hypothetical protein JCM33374_g2408 [Metschnikowia sp. JCM 33374]